MSSAARATFTTRTSSTSVSLIAFFAWVGLGADGLSSSCYGPQEAFLALSGHTHLALFVALASGRDRLHHQRQLLADHRAVPDRRRRLPGGQQAALPEAGMVSGCALLIDYVLTITISIASGADALFSFLPAAWLPYKLTISHCWRWSADAPEPARRQGVGAAAGADLHGLRPHPRLSSSSMRLAANSGHFPAMVAATTADAASVRRSTRSGLFGMLLLVLRAYSMGAGTYTGIEAVSNGLPILREPRVQTGKRTMLYMAVSLAFMAMGLMVAYLLYGVTPEHGKTLNAVLFETVTQAGARGGYVLLIVTLVSEARYCSGRGPDGLPRRAAGAGQHGPGPLVPGQVRHAQRPAGHPERHPADGAGRLPDDGAYAGARWISSWCSTASTSSSPSRCPSSAWCGTGGSSAAGAEHWKKKLFINGLGLSLTSFILVSVVILKFTEGGWITIVITGLLIGMALLIKRHYRHTAKLLSRLDSLVEAAGYSIHEAPSKTPGNAPAADPRAKTAIILVSGYNGLGLHTFLNVIRQFGGTFKNFVFIEVGIVDAGTFKGAEELEALKKKVNEDLDKYVKLARTHGLYAEGYSSFGTDVVGEISKVSPKILERFPNVTFFGGQLVFPNPNIFTGMLHNYTIFAVQRYFYNQGIPIMLMPVRV